VRGVYTPGFLVNGRGWRPGWFRSEPSETEQQAGILQVSLEDGRLRVRYEGEEAQGGVLELHVAVLGMGLDTAIGAGENAGRHSQHEFVVLSHRRAPPGGPDWSLPLVVPTTHGADRHALVAWVSRPGDPTSLQAVGGYLPGNGRG
jgi:hypothetical protein